MAKDLAILGYAVGPDSLRIADSRIEQVLKIFFPQNPKGVVYRPIAWITFLFPHQLSRQEFAGRQPLLWDLGIFDENHLIAAVGETHARGDVLKLVCKHEMDEDR